MAYTNTATPAFKVTPSSKNKRTVRTFMEQAKQRRALARLSDDQLSDIGITTAQRDAECGAASKSFQASPSGRTRTSWSKAHAQILPWAF